MGRYGQNLWPFMTIYGQRSAWSLSGYQIKQFIVILFIKPILLPCIAVRVRIHFIILFYIVAGINLMDLKHQILCVQYTLCNVR